MTGARAVGGGSTGLEIRDLQLADTRASASIHHEVLGMEFLSRFGPGFLAAYHGAWVRSPAGLALAAVDGDGRLVGLMLGSLDPAAHYRWMLRQAGPGLAVRLAGRAVLDPPLARDLIVTRGARYARGVWRHLANRRGRAAAGAAGTEPADQETDPGPPVGEITHLMVASSGQGTGAGRALVAETEARARSAGIEELVLVTPPDLDARGFYNHLGWVEEGDMSSRSGESFIRFRRRL